jgi:hypothetical protein
MLQAMAQQTGGLVVEETALPAFVKNPFFVVDGGGTAFFPLERTKRFVWEADPRVTVDVAYGDKHLYLTTIAPLTEASVSETGSYLWSRYYLAAYTGGGVLALLCVPFLLRRRKGLPVQSAGQPKPLALLQDINTGIIHLVSSYPAQLGRLSDNDVVLDEKTVSRCHAIMMRADDGRITIGNRSRTSPLRVNNEPVDECELKNGDIISLGETKLRFAVAAGK